MIREEKKEETYDCDNCNIKYTNFNEYLFHMRVDCPMRERTIYYITETRCLPSKKHRRCYRCGRIGHYYGKKECYAVKDVDNNLITWGEARKLERDNPKKKLGTYSSKK